MSEHHEDDDLFVDWAAINTALDEQGRRIARAQAEDKIRDEYLYAVTRLTIRIGLMHCIVPLFPCVEDKE
jgi:hypothetical protein